MNQFIRLQCFQKKRAWTLKYWCVDLKIPKSSKEQFTCNFEQVKPLPWGKSEPDIVCSRCPDTPYFVKIFSWYFDLKNMWTTFWTTFLRYRKTEKISSFGSFKIPLFSAAQLYSPFIEKPRLSFSKILPPQKLKFLNQF